jgi:hypothetical protein
MDRKVELDHHDLFIDGRYVAPSTGNYSISTRSLTCIVAASAAIRRQD